MNGKSNPFGMGYPVVALVDTYTPGTGVTYQQGMVLGTGVEAVLNQTMNDTPDYGDDEVQDIDNGVNEVSGTLELNVIGPEKLATILGWTASGEGANAVYKISDNAAPDAGFGYYEKCGAKWLCRWVYRVKFSRETVTARTRERNTEWNHPTLSFRSQAMTDANGTYHYEEHLVNDREAAKTWLNGKAGIASTGASAGG